MGQGNKGGGSSQRFDNYVVIESLSDFPTPLGGEITLEEDFTYWINGRVNIGTNEIILPARCTIKGFSTFQSILESDTTGTLLTGAAIENLQLDNVGIECAGGTLFDLTGGAVGIIFMDFVVSFTATTLGTITDMFSIVMKAGWFNFTNGITIEGTIAVGFTMNESVYATFTGTALDLGSSTITNFKASNCSWIGTGGSSTDLDGLAASGNIAVGGAGIVTGCVFSTTGTVLNNITNKDLRWNFSNNSIIPDSTVTGVSQMIGGALTTTIPEANARVLMNITGAVGAEENRTSVATDGVTTYNALETELMKFDGNILLEPASSTKNVACQFVAIDSTQTVVTFTNGTNLINDTATPLVDGDQMTFKDNAGTLPAELFDDVIYYVVNQATNSYQLEYEPGDGVIALTDDGSGTNSYKVAELHGAIPPLPIAANNPRTLVPQSLRSMSTSEETAIVVINQDDDVNIEVSDTYYRMML